MASVILQHTDVAGVGDVLLYDDNSVTVNGVAAGAAVVTEYQGLKRIALDGDSNLHVNPQPEFGRIRITRQPGWQDNIGYRVELLDFAEDKSPGVFALAEYNNPGGRSYKFTTGGFLLDGETGIWGSVCPPGFEQGSIDIYFGILYASILYSSFTLFAQYDESIFYCGGDA